MTADAIEDASTALRSFGFTGTVETVISLVSNSGSPAEMLTDPIAVPYDAIPGFPAGLASGRAVVGNFEGTRVAVLEGRPAFVHSGGAAAFRLPLRTMAALGARSVVSATHAVSLQADIYPGSLVVVSDHINFNSSDPLAGLEGDHSLVSMKDAYDARLRRRFKASASASGVSAQEGVCFALPGSWPETVAEARFARNAGADVLGAGLAPEVIVARWLGLRTAALAVVTGFAAGIGPPTQTGGAKDATLAGAIGLRRILRAFLKHSED